MNEAETIIVGLAQEIGTTEEVGEMPTGLPLTWLMAGALAEVAKCVAAVSEEMGQETSEALGIVGRSLWLMLGEAWQARGQLVGDLTGRRQGGEMDRLHAHWRLEVVKSLVGALVATTIVSRRAENKMVKDRLDAGLVD